MSQLATVPAATNVTRRVKDAKAVDLAPPVFVDVSRADAIYADGPIVVIEQGPKVWRFTTPDAEGATKTAEELARLGSRRGGPR